MTKLNCEPMLFLDACIGVSLSEGGIEVKDLKVATDYDLGKLLLDISKTEGFKHAVENLLSSITIREDSKILKYSGKSFSNITCVSTSGNVVNIVYDNLQFIVKARREDTSHIWGYVSISCYTCEKDIPSILNECALELKSNRYCQ